MVDNNSSLESNEDPKHQVIQDAFKASGCDDGRAWVEELHISIIVPPSMSPDIIIIPPQFYDAGGAIGIAPLAIDSRGNEENLFKIQNKKAQFKVMFEVSSDEFKALIFEVYNEYPSEENVKAYIRKVLRGGFNFLR